MTSHRRCNAAPIVMQAQISFFLLISAGIAVAFQLPFCRYLPRPSPSVSRFLQDISSYKLKDSGGYYQYDYETKPLTNKIVLTKEEEDLFYLVRQVRDEYAPSTTVRIAGGWVRDKLLHHYQPTVSHDIDFVLDNKSGSEFAKLFHNYILQNNNNTDDQENVACEISSEASSNNSLLKEYGSRSQHLQTASVKYGNFWIDFCNLRFEKYSPDSRVPEKTGMASAVEDAWRRDLTINSLFYNVNTNQVEDWTEQGLQDLQLGIIATPTAPLATLLEDPLRILRAIRFAAQLSFSMDPDLKKAALNQRVGRALEQKVSKSRIGNEIDLMFQTRDPTRGVQLLMETNVMPFVFPLKGKHWKLEASPMYIYKSGIRLLSRTQALVSRIFVEPSQWNDTRRRFLWYAAFFKPFVDMTTSTEIPVESRGFKRSRRNGSILYQLMIHGLKQPTCDTQSIEGIIKGANALQTFLKAYAESSAVQHLMKSSIHFGTLSEHDSRWNDLSDFRWASYKILKQIGPFWRESLLLALAMPDEDLGESINLFHHWVTIMVDRLGLNDDIFDQSYLKPLLNGSEIQQRALPGVQGEGFKQIMRAQEEWQVRYDYCAGANALDRSSQEAKLIEYLVETFPEYTG